MKSTVLAIGLLAVLAAPPTTLAQEIFPNGLSLPEPWRKNPEKTPGSKATPHDLRKPGKARERQAVEKKRAPKPISHHAAGKNG